MNKLNLFKQAQRGIVLVIVLVVLVAMTLAGLALVRSVDTTVLATGNFAFKQQTLVQPERAIEQAVRALYGNYDGTALVAPPAITDPTANLLTENYYAAFQAGESTVATAGVPAGIPAALQPTGTYPATFRTIGALPATDEIRYVIERMCTVAGPPSLANCNMARAGIAAAGGTTHDENVQVPETPLYRVTVRVDGPRNTVTYAQAIVR